MDVEWDDRSERWLPRVLPDEERPAAWLAARAGYGAATRTSYAAFEFTDDAGRVLLFIETYC